MQQTAIPPLQTRDRWHKEPWMLLVMGGPLIVVVAAFITLYLAFHGADKVLSNDYYAEGLKINQNIARDTAAQVYKLKATMRLDLQTEQLLLDLQGKNALPQQIKLDISASSANSLTNEITKTLVLHETSPGKYEASLKEILTGTPISHTLWRIVVQADDWRLLSDWNNPGQQALQLGSPSPQ